MKISGPVSLLETQHKNNNRCLDLKISSFNELDNNSLNEENIIDDKITKKKLKTQVLQINNIKHHNKNDINEFVLNNLSYKNPNRPKS